MLKQALFRVWALLRQPQRSLLSKGLVALALVIATIALCAVGIVAERQRLLVVFDDLQEAVVRGERLFDAETHLAQALLEVSAVVYSDDPATVPNLTLALEGAAASMTRVTQVLPGLELARQRLEAKVALSHAANNAASWEDLRVSLRTLRNEIRGQRLEQERRVVALRGGFLGIFRFVTWTWMVVTAIGLLAVTVLLTVFLLRLVRDVRRVQARAEDIVEGYRGAPMNLPRQDEIGVLARAVDGMEARLRSREAQLALEEQARAYAEKMAALGAMSLGVAHEVNNPLMLIGEQARALELRGEPEGAVIRDAVERAARATRHLSEVAVQQPSEREWVDLKSLLGQTIDLMRYDQRFRRVEFVLLDAPSAPAVYTVPAQLQQALFVIIEFLAESVRERGTITVRCEDESGTAVCELADGDGAAARGVLEAARGEELPTSGRRGTRALRIAQMTLAALGVSSSSRSRASGTSLLLAFPRAETA